MDITKIAPPPPQPEPPADINIRLDPEEAQILYVLASLLKYVPYNRTHSAWRSKLSMFRTRLRVSLRDVGVCEPDLLCGPDARD